MGRSSLDVSGGDPMTYTQNMWFEFKDMVKSLYDQGLSVQEMAAKTGFEVWIVEGCLSQIDGVEKQ